MSAATSMDQAYRGPAADRPRGVPLPPDPMPLFRAGTLRKRWHYVGFWSPEILVCAAHVHVGPLPNEYWGVWDRRQQRFREGNRYLTRRVSLAPGQMVIDDGDVGVDVRFAPDDEFEVYRPLGSAYIWSHKQFSARATAEIRLGSGSRRAQGAVFVDVNDGYHPRLTRWRWSVGAGTDQRGRAVAWSVVVGLFDTARNSERTIWIDGVGSEPGPVRFSDDLASVSFAEGGSLSFRQEANLKKRVGLLLIKTKYDHAFGSYQGSLPGGITLVDAVGAREQQDALW